MRKIILLCTLFAFISCGHYSARTDSAVKGLSFIKHSITYTRKGMRSEAKHGHISIKGVQIPDVFALVVQGNAAYRFYQRKHRWGRDGYHPVKVPAFAEINSSITAESARRGWYRGRNRLKGTPLNWLYVEWGKGSGFVAHGSIGGLIKEFKLRIMKRDISAVRLRR